MRLINRSNEDGNCFWEYLADDGLQSDCEASFSTLVSVLGSEALASEYVMSEGSGLTELKNRSPAELAKEAAVWADASLAGLPPEAWALPLTAIGISAAADMLFWDRDNGQTADDGGITGFEEAFWEGSAADDAEPYSAGDAGFEPEYAGGGYETALWEGGSGDADFASDGGFDFDGGFG